MDEEAAQEVNKQGHLGILAGAGKSNDFRLDGVFADYAWLTGFPWLSKTSASRSL
jgi:hypothetical protein